MKIHNSYRKIIAICDSDIISKTFEEGIRQIIIGENFFRGQEKSEEEVLEIMEKASAEDATFNIVGNQSVKLALKAGLIKPKGIIKIQGVSIALSLL